MEPSQTSKAKLEGEGTVVGKRAPDFVLPDRDKAPVKLSEICAKGPALLVFYPGDFTMVCTKQLCNYRDNLAQFSELKIQIVGISPNEPRSHSEFAERYKFTFPLLSDPKRLVAKSFGCTSIFMAGLVSRAIFIVNKDRVILYRYVEPTILTRRSADELLAIIGDLRQNNLL